jgi:two-component system response regulator HydG
VLQEREVIRVGGEEVIKVDVRVIAATNKDLTRQVQDGRFREDLYYRLNVVTLNVPPLRNRKEDIPLIAHHFLKLFAEKNHKNVKGFTPRAMDRLLKYEWPGNVRELMNAIERGVVLSRLDYLDEEEFSLLLQDQARLDGIYSRQIELDAPSLETVEKETVLKALGASGGNKSETARRLGITRRTLHMKLKKYGMM